jgi:hypothetical protein
MSVRLVDLVDCGTHRFDAKQKWSNPLMGWTSGADTMGNQLMENLTFDSE